MIPGSDSSASEEPNADAQSGRRGERVSRFAASAAVLLLTFSPINAAAAQQSASRPSGNPCLQCHTGIENQSATWNGRRFTHAPHLERAKLDCTFCHTSMEQHGGTKLQSAAACNDCHHTRTSGSSCSRCHSGGAGAPKGLVAHQAGDFDHGRHTAAGLTCVTCHAGASMSTANVDCMACHTAHHRPESTCVACHRAGTTPGHPIEIHVSGCQGCHGEKSAWIDRWTRETCAVCHTGREGHYPERPCALCHIVPSMPVTGGD